jgi:hypothetical protein
LILADNNENKRKNDLQDLPCGAKTGGDVCFFISAFDKYVVIL